MKKLIVLLSLLFGSVSTYSQPIDCPSTLSFRKASPPYTYNELSKSMQCSTDKKYEYDISLKAGKEYQISFFASATFNNRMFFKIIDTNTGQKLLDLPGQTEENKKGECVLKEYYDFSSEKLVYPYFNFEPKETLNVKIIIDIPEYKYKLKIADADPDLGTEEKFEEITEKRKGCVTIFIQDMVSEDIGSN